MNGRIKKILLIGNPNVGKSVIFSRLTGAKVIKTIYSGLVCLEEKQKLNKKQLKLAESVGGSLLA